MAGIPDFFNQSNEFLHKDSLYSINLNHSRFETDSAQ
jgi:hypothetical protein